MLKATLPERLHEAGEADLFTAYEVAVLLNALSAPKAAAKKLIGRSTGTCLFHALALGVASGLLLTTDRATVCNAVRQRSDASLLRLLGYVSSWEVTRHAMLAHLPDPSAN